MSSRNWNNSIVYNTALSRSSSSSNSSRSLIQWDCYTYVLYINNYINVLCLWSMNELQRIYLESWSFAHIEKKKTKNYHKLFAQFWYPWHPLLGFMGQNFTNDTLSPGLSPDSASNFFFPDRKALLNPLCATCPASIPTVTRALHDLITKCPIYNHKGGNQSKLLKLLFSSRSWPPLCYHDPTDICVLPESKPIFWLCSSGKSFLSAVAVAIAGVIGE